MSAPAERPAARRFGLFDLLEPRTGPPAPREPDPPIGTWITCPSCGGTGDNNLQRDGHGDGYRCTTCDGGGRLAVRGGPHARVGAGRVGGVGSTR